MSNLTLHYNEPEIVNVGVEQYATIKETAELIKEVVGFEGELHFDTDKPDGTPRKLLDTSKINGLGWHAKIGFKEGLQSTYAWFLQHEADFRR